MAAPRWAVSFADLGLLLLGCFVLLHAMESARPKAGPVAGAGATPTPRGQLYRARDLFEAGEARLGADAARRLQDAGRALAGRRVAIVSHGAAEASDRLDRFELSAARAAAVGRALQQGGARTGDLDLRIAQPAGAPAGQTIAVVPQ